MRARSFSVLVAGPPAGSHRRRERNTMSINTNKDQIVFPAQPPRENGDLAPKDRRGKVILLSVLGGAVLLTAIAIGTANSGTTTASEAATTAWSAFLDKAERVMPYVRVLLVGIAVGAL